MSFHTIEPAPARLNRSELAVPGSQPKLFEKAAKSAAEGLVLVPEGAAAPTVTPPTPPPTPRLAARA